MRPDETLDTTKPGQHDQPCDLVKNENRWFHRFFDRSFHLTWLLDVDGTLLDANPSALTFGKVKATQIIGHALTDATGWTFLGKGRSQLQAAVTAAATGEVVRYDADVQGTGDHMATLDLTIRSIEGPALTENLGDPCQMSQQIIVEGTDVSDRKRLETRFLRIQRLESLSALKLGILHDLHNLLALTSMTAKLLQTKLITQNDHQQKLFKVLESSTNRANKLAKEMFSFACGTEQNHDVLKIESLVQNIQRIIQSTFSNSITIETVVAPNLWPLEGNENQISQVLLNLCLNARDAMPQGGHLRLSVENMGAACPDEQITKLEALFKDHPTQNFVVITVADTGSGIPAQFLDKIFDPFFTTKSKDMGTGLGLSSSLNIIQNHGGFIDVLSSPKSGTQFRVVLPAASQPSISPKLKPGNSRPNTATLQTQQSR